jgi:hypothetical protein
MAYFIKSLEGVYNEIVDVMKKKIWLFLSGRNYVKVSNIDHLNDGQSV